jgi:hypothetical protein
MVKSGERVMASGYFSSNDPFQFGSTFMSASSLFPGPGLAIRGSPASGDLWVDLPKATVQKLQGAQALVLDKKPLNKVDAQNFARFFAGRASAAQIPWILGPASLIPGVGTVITIVTSTVDGIERLAAGTVDAEQLSVLMAEGGAFVRTLALEGAARLTASVLYTVKIGNESRTYAVCSQTFALNAV